MMDADRPPPPLDLERFLPYRLAILSDRVSGAIARLYAHRFRLTIPEWRAMAVLGRFGAMTAGGIGERAEMDKVRVSRAVARLAAAGHVDRRLDESDRRRAVLDLTSSGRAVYAEIAPLALAVERRLLARLDPNDRAALARVLEKLEAVAATDFANTGASARGDASTTAPRPRLAGRSGD
jgi:DNA-binding MarR family transcriptional regulator